MAQTAASSVNKDMELSMERLATGKRINGASDDAAGVAIASRLTAEIRGTNQAIRNAMDGQALVDTAEGAHQEVESILQRMRELAVQASNDTNDADDRTNLNTELTALVAELDRIAETTSWAGQTLLDGTFASSGVNFHVGSRTASADTITHTIAAVDADALGFAADSSTTATIASIVNGASNATLAHSSGTFTATLTTTTETVTVGTEANTDDDVAVALAMTNSSGVITVGTAGATTGDGENDTVELDFGDDVSVTYTSAGGLTTATEATALAAALNADSDFAGAFLATVGTGTNTSKVTISDKVAAGDITFTVDSTAVTVTLAGGETAAEIGAAAETAMDAALGARYSFTDNSDGTVDIAKAALAAVELDTRANALLAIDAIDSAITTVNTQRAELGSVSNRLDSTVSNLTNISANLQAGRGRIEDADFAAETTSLAKSQILQQASTAMLAQANASKQNVLSLLQG